MVTPQCSLEPDDVKSTNTTTKLSEPESLTADKKRKQLYLLVLLKNDVPSTQTNSSVETVLDDHSYANRPTSTLSPEHISDNSATKNANYDKPAGVCCPARPVGGQLSSPVPVGDQSLPPVPPAIRIRYISGGVTGQMNTSNSSPAGQEDDQKETKMKAGDTKSIFECRYCEKTFNRISYRTKHIHRVHKRTSRGEQKNITTFPCTLCDKVYDYKNSLQRHVELIHVRKEEKCQFCSFTTHRKYKLKKHVIKVHLDSPTPTNTEQLDCELYECSNCPLKFSNKKKLRYHELKKHNIQRFLRRKIARKCPLCSFCSSKNRKHEINNHFKDEHNLTINEDSYSFQDIQQFYDWKRQLEIDTKTSFIKAHYSTTNTLTYVCHRRGQFKSRGTNQRQLKMIGSCKINGHCPSEINARVNGDGNISVKYIATHVGHKNELNFIRLRPEERRTVVNQILSNTPHNEILKTVQSSLMNQELQRIHLLSKKDIINIEKSLLNIGKGLGIENYEEEIVQVDLHEDKSGLKIEEDPLNDMSLVENEEDETEQNRLRHLFEEIIKNAKSKAQIDFVEKKIKETFTTIQTIESPQAPPAQVQEDSSVFYPFIDYLDN